MTELTVHTSSPAVQAEAAAPRRSLDIGEWAMAWVALMLGVLPALILISGVGWGVGVGGGQILTWICGLLLAAYWPALIWAAWIIGTGSRSARWPCDLFWSLAAVESVALAGVLATMIGAR